MIKERVSPIVFPSPMLFNERRRIVGPRRKHRLPTMSMARGVELAASWPNDRALPTCIGCPDYVDKILKGAKPADLPVGAAHQIELIITSRPKALGLTIPPSLLAARRRGDPVTTRRAFRNACGGSLPHATAHASMSPKNARIGFLRDCDRSVAGISSGHSTGDAGAGCTEERNVAIERRFADGKPERLPALPPSSSSSRWTSRDRSNPVIDAVKKATATIRSSWDVERSRGSGFIASLARREEHHRVDRDTALTSSVRTSSS